MASTFSSRNHDLEHQLVKVEQLLQIKRFAYLNFISDLVRWIVSTQDVDSVSHTHCSSIEPSTLKWPFTLPHTGLWTKTVDLEGKKAYFEPCA